VIFIGCPFVTALAWKAVKPVIADVGKLVNDAPLPLNRFALNVPPTCNPSVVLIAQELPTPQRKHSAPLNELSVLPADDVALTLAVFTWLLSADNAGARFGSASAVNHA
jgi:hypothetical protein